MIQDRSAINLPSFAWLCLAQPLVPARGFGRGQSTRSDQKAGLDRQFNLETLTLTRVHAATAAYDKKMKFKQERFKQGLSSTTRRPAWSLPCIRSMLRIHLMQNWFGLSDPWIEEVRYEIVPLRRFARLPLTRALPDETTVLNFPRPFKKN